MDGEVDITEMENKPHIYILATGGTISAKAADKTFTTGYTASTIGVRELVEAVPEMERYARISGEQVTNVLSHSLTHDVWLKLGRRINGLFGLPDVDGIVVTHGTNTLEETAYFLNLVVKSEKPVIVTGAMRPATAISADGPANLLSAVRLAVSREALGQGVMVFLNDQINSARDVSKTHTTALDTFRSPEMGALGTLHEGTAFFFRSSTRRNTLRSEFDISTLAELPRVDILYSHVNDDLVHLRAILAAGAKGIVVAATGNGMMSDTVHRGLVEARNHGIVVVRSSRCGSGMVTKIKLYDESGFVAAGACNPAKARILLMLALTKTAEPSEIQRMFDEY